jgi:sulfite exporter TauE/SafE
MNPLLAGVALGLASSAHCAAMCGPLVLTVGRRLGGPSRGAQARHALVYHAGRMIVYASLAIPAGLGGQALAVRGFGRGLAVGAGILLLAAALGAARLPPFDRVGARLSALVSRAFTPLLRRASTRPMAGALALGALNGLLPCGLVYAALTAAAAAGTPTAAILLMLGFGLGTSGILIAIALGAAAVPPSLRARLRPLAPLALAITAVVLLVRGVTLPHAHPGSVHGATPAAHAHHTRPR